MIQRMQFSENQKDKLIEMALKLFPEYKEISIQGAYIYFNRGIIPLDSIPIFEFCMTHLVDKITSIGKFNYPDVDIELISCWYKPHPIDYLYKEFTNLKIKL